MSAASDVKTVFEDQAAQSVWTTEAAKGMP